VDLLDKVSSKEWKLPKFLESLESLEWEERTLEKEGFETFSPEWKESLRSNGFGILMPFFYSRQVSCSPHDAIFFQSNWCFNELGSMNMMRDQYAPALRMITSRTNRTRAKAAARIPPPPYPAQLAPPPTA
jgi:hypothetical protein